MDTRPLADRERQPLCARCRIRRRRISKNADIAARLRSFAYNLLRAAGCDNIKNARWRAALDLNVVLSMPGLY